MKLRDEVQRIKYFSHLEEGEIFYNTSEDGRGCIMTDDGLYEFNGFKIYKFYKTPEEELDMSYNGAIGILENIEIVHELLNYIGFTPIMDLYESDLDGTGFKLKLDNHLQLIVFEYFEYSERFTLRCFDIDFESFYMKLDILEGDSYVVKPMKHYTSSGYLSPKSISSINRDLNAKYFKSILNTSYDIYYDDCQDYGDMIKRAKEEIPISKKGPLKVHQLKKKNQGESLWNQI